MIFDEARQLVEADRHICDAHRAIQHQRKTVAELKASGKPSHAANALLALMILMLPIVEDLRQQIVRYLLPTELAPVVGSRPSEGSDAHGIDLQSMVRARDSGGTPCRHRAQSVRQSDPIHRRMCRFPASGSSWESLARGGVDDTMHDSLASAAGAAAIVAGFVRISSRRAALGGSRCARPFAPRRQRGRDYRCAQGGCPSGGHSRQPRPLTCLCSCRQGGTFR